MTINIDVVPGLPDDLNPEIVKATAAFIGQITGLVPPPHDAFPPEWYGYLRTFTARVKEIAGENAVPGGQRADLSSEDASLIERLQLLASCDGLLIKSEFANTTISRAIQRLAAAHPSNPATQADHIADERKLVAVDYDRVVSICEAHGIGLPVDCIEMVVEIIRLAASPAAPAQSGAPGAVPPRWYTVDEIRHMLKCMNYCDEIAIELSTWSVRHLQLAFNKGFEKGQRTAAPPPAAGDKA